MKSIDFSISKLKLVKSKQCAKYEKYYYRCLFSKNPGNRIKENDKCVIKRLNLRKNIPDGN
jgi:hypothetical protein